ncbi:hypothetical protein H6G93_37295 [Nostoc sp. FACHB-973]|nr:hypothetical protein [Nostoc sp. FACHB-973]
MEAGALVFASPASPASPAYPSSIGSGGAIAKITNQSSLRLLSNHQINRRVN